MNKEGPGRRKVLWALEFILVAAVIVSLLASTDNGRLWRRWLWPRWSTQEHAALESMWIENLPPPPPQPSNRVADDP
ncbi:MAG TPA: hypothetical protein VLS48_06565, partial [Anaerolineales bacterium]|nr:hypothetical protein [Anaerolineales bacterium]